MSSEFGLTLTPVGESPKPDVALVEITRAGDRLADVELQPEAVNLVVDELGGVATKTLFKLL